MIKLYDGGAYLVNGTDIVPATSEAPACIKSKTGIEAKKEEQDMITEFGTDYQNYMKKTTMFIPHLV